MRRRRGMTLVEMLVSAAVALVALAAVFSVFYPAQTFFAQANELSTLYADAMTTLDRLSVEIEEAGPWVTNATSANPPALALPSARNANNEFQRNSDGTPRWQKWILYYVSSDASGLVLVRKELAGTFPPSPLPYTIPSTALTPPGAGSKVVCRNVSLFRVETSVAPTGGTRCLVELVLSQITKRLGPGDAPATHSQRFQRAAVTRNIE